MTKIEKTRECDLEEKDQDIGGDLKGEFTVIGRLSGGGGLDEIVEMIKL